MFSRGLWLLFWLLLWNLLLTLLCNGSLGSLWWRGGASGSFWGRLSSWNLARRRVSSHWTLCNLGFLGTLRLRSGSFTRWLRSGSLGGLWNFSRRWQSAGWWTRNSSWCILRSFSWWWRFWTLWSFDFRLLLLLLHLFFLLLCFALLNNWFIVFWQLDFVLFNRLLLLLLHLLLLLLLFLLLVLLLNYFFLLLLFLLDIVLTELLVNLLWIVL